MAARRRRATWMDGIRMGIDMAYNKGVSFSLVYRDGKWWPV